MTRPEDILDILAEPKEHVQLTRREAVGRTGVDVQFHRYASVSKADGVVDVFVGESVDCADA